MIQGWSQDEIDLGEIWSTDWNPGYYDCDAWQGILGDLAWRVEHAYGFPGHIIPQAYMYDEYCDSQRLLFRLGNRYFVYSADAEPDERLRSWPVFPSARNRFFLPSEAELESYTRGSALTDSDMYKSMFMGELQETEWRNRWIEQAERGGQPHQNLLLKP